MKVEILLILAVLMVFLGGILGGGYAYLSTNEIVAQIPDIMSAKQTPEESLIEDFIAKQEEIHPDGINDIAISTNDKKDLDKKTEPTTTEAKDKEPTKKTTSGSSKGQQMGQPTVQDGIPLNVRSGPSQTDKVITKLNNTDKIVLLSQENGWYHIQTAEGVEGFVSAEYVKVIK